MTNLAEALDFPLPKYRKGATVWNGHVNQRRKDFPCPDCLGTKRWKVMTPAGSELEAECQRCNSSYGQRNIPSLTSFEYVATAQSLTIGSVEINTNSSYGEHPVRYMCVETGIGSGSVYYENRLYETEEMALAAAKLDAQARNAEKAAEPERIEQMTFSYLTIADAKLKAADDAIWSSWYRYRNLREDIEGLIDDKTPSTYAELCDAIRWSMEWDKDHRADGKLFDSILEAAKKAAAKWRDDELMDALGKLPSMIQRRRELMASDGQSPGE